MRLRTPHSMSQCRVTPIACFGAAACARAAPGERSVELSVELLGWAVRLGF
jgi:hypothetical protein